jgi:enoyl-CoA hydratase
MSSVRLEFAPPIASIILARPESRNALTPEMGDEVERAVTAINARDDIRAVIVRGEGKAFSAGGDLAFIADRIASTPEENKKTMRTYYRKYLSVLTLRVPTIAAIQGAAMGAGVCFALACDVRIAARGTTIGLNFVRLGLHPGMGATLLLPRLVGAAHAAELLLTGRSIDAEEALRIGLISAVHERDEMLDAVTNLANEIAAAGPIAVSSTTRALRAYSTRYLDAALEDEASEQARDYASRDVAEGLAAVKERRSARFEGR